MTEILQQFKKGDLVTRKETSRVWEVQGYSESNPDYLRIKRFKDKKAKEMKYEAKTFVLVDPDNLDECSNCNDIMVKNHEKVVMSQCSKLMHNGHCLNKHNETCSTCENQISSSETGDAGSMTETDSSDLDEPSTEIVSPKEGSKDPSTSSQGKLFMLLDLNEIECDNESYQPRSKISEEKFQELKESINSTDGNLEPAIMWYNNNSYITIAGHRRFKACKELNKKLAAMVYFELTDKEAWEIAITTNIKEDMAMSDLVRSVINLHDLFNETEAEIAYKIGKSEDTVKRYLRLSTMHPLIFDYIDSGELGIFQAQWVAEVEESEQEWFAKEVILNKWKPKQTKSYVSLWNELHHKIKSQLKEGKENWDSIANRIKLQKSIDRSKQLWIKAGIPEDYKHLDWLAEQAVENRFSDEDIKDNAEMILYKAFDFVAHMKSSDSISWDVAYELFADYCQIDEYKKEYGPVLEGILHDIEHIYDQPPDLLVKPRKIVWVADGKNMRGELQQMIRSWMKRTFDLEPDATSVLDFYQDDTITLQQFWDIQKTLIDLHLDDQIVDCKYCDETHPIELDQEEYHSIIKCSVCNEMKPQETLITNKVVCKDCAAAIFAEEDPSKLIKCSDCGKEVEQGNTWEFEGQRYCSPNHIRKIENQRAKEAAQKAKLEHDKEWEEGAKIHHELEKKAAQSDTYDPDFDEAIVADIAKKESKTVEEIKTELECCEKNKEATCKKCGMKLCNIHSRSHHYTHEKKSDGGVIVDSYFDPQPEDLYINPERHNYHESDKHKEARYRAVLMENNLQLKGNYSVSFSELFKSLDHYKEHESKARYTKLHTIAFNFIRYVLDWEHPGIGLVYHYENALKAKKPDVISNMIIKQTRFMVDLLDPTEPPKFSWGIGFCVFVDELVDGKTIFTPRFIAQFVADCLPLVDFMSAALGHNGPIRETLTDEELDKLHEYVEQFSARN